MTRVTITTQGFKKLEKAIRNNPKVVAVQGRLFLNRGIMAYRRVIEGAPWRVGQSGGGVPVDTGDLKRSHTYSVQGLKGVVKFDENPNPSGSRSPYGAIVHGRESKSTRMRGKNLKTRPWLNYAVNQADGEVERLYRAFLKEVTSKLAS